MKINKKILAKLIKDTTSIIVQAKEYDSYHELYDFLCDKHFNIGICYYLKNTKISEKDRFSFNRKTHPIITKGMHISETQMTFDRKRFNRNPDGFWCGTPSVINPTSEDATVENIVNLLENRLWILKEIRYEISLYWRIRRKYNWE